MSPNPATARVVGRYRRYVHRIGFKLRPLLRLLSVGAENPALFTAGTVFVTLAATAAVTWVSTIESSRYLIALLISLVVILPFAGSVAFYLLNITLDHRAEIAVRTRRYSDEAILSYLRVAAARLVSEVFDIQPSGSEGNHPNNERRSSNPPIAGVAQAPIKARETMEVEREHARSQARYFHVLVDHVAHHFRVPTEIIENCLCMSAAVLEENAPQRVWYRYQIDSMVDPNFERNRPAALALDAYAQRIWRRVHQLEPIVEDVALILRHVIHQPSTGKAMAAAAPILARNLNPPRSGVVRELVDIRLGVPLTLMFGMDKWDMSDGRSLEGTKHYLNSFKALAEEFSEAAAYQAAADIGKRIRDGSLILTVGYSHLISQVISLLSKQMKDITVGVISPDRASRPQHVLFRDEERLMEAELLADAKLPSRLFVSSVPGMRELGLDREDAIVLMGAEAVTSDGQVVHPRGWKSTHDDLQRYLNQDKGTGRFVVCESFKIIDTLPPQVELRRLVTVFKSDEYELLISDGGSWSQGGHSSGPLIRLREAWEKRINRVRQSASPGV